jgi:hypothetical protein
MNEDEITRRYQSLSSETQARALLTFGHSLTVAARDTYEVQAAGVRALQRLSEINELQHRVFAQILALLMVDPHRYPDDVLVAMLLRHNDDHLRAQSLRAFADALERATHEPADTSSS